MLTATAQQIKDWLVRYGANGRDGELDMCWFDEDQMYDDLCCDLDIAGDDQHTRKQIVKAIREYIRTH